jgi:hypothetical protein
MSDERTKPLFKTLIASILSICGCGQPVAPAQQRNPAPTILEEIAISGFDPEGEPVIKKWSDGSLWIHFQAMPPFFSEDNGTEAEFANFESKIRQALGVAVRRDDREVFVITNPNPDTAAKAKEWLEAFRKKDERE